MRRGMWELCLLVIVVIGLHAERVYHRGSVVGSISPAKSFSSVMAVKGNDSVRVYPREGHFGMELQPGDWTLIFALNQIYGTPTEKKVQVREGQRLNLGEIRLSN